MGFISTIIRQGVGATQMGMATEELKRLPGSREYSLNQDLATATALARKGAQQGMTPEERAVAEQGIGTQQSRTQRAMEQRGLGGLAAAISQSSATDAFNQLEASNQQIKRDYLGKYGELGSKVQALENANVTSFNQQLAAQQRELGMAAQQGYAGLAGSAAQMAGMAGDNAEKWAEQYKESRAADAKLTAEDLAFTESGDKLAPWAPEGTTSGVDAEGNPISMSPNYSPDVDAMSGGFDSSLGYSPEGTMTGELGTSFDAGGLDYSGLDTIDMSSFDMSSMGGDMGGSVGGDAGM